ncbi:hypothetical protein BJ165DRAFT_1501774 [Panaeolus papilionaceus]|nr:hypothetical protein BJ165DRAFT_1501774 [Panaeolus papilionaceus]
MNTSLKHITNAAIRRAQAADPNSQRCLIENCSEQRAVRLVHVFRRDAPIYMIEGMEWCWNMAKETLNLDTRQNIFFVGASMHQLYRDKQWALLPDEDMVFRYLNQRKLRPLKRYEFPQIEGDSFQYRFLPLNDMEDVVITRQTTTKNNHEVAIHHYPFDDFPVITTHVHPKYAILHLGQLFYGRLTCNKKVLIAKYPWLHQIVQLYQKWTYGEPEGAEEIPSYISKSFQESSVSGLFSEVEPEESCTPLRRIPSLQGHVDRDTATSSRNHGAPFSDHHSGATTRVSIPACHRRRLRKRPAVGAVEGPEQRPNKRTLTSKALKRQDEREDLESVKWTSERLAMWAEKSSTPLFPPPFSPPPPLSLPSPPRPASSARLPLRRSARIKAKARKA